MAGKPPLWQCTVLLSNADTSLTETQQPPPHKCAGLLGQRTLSDPSVCTSQCSVHSCQLSLVMSEAAVFYHQWQRDLPLLYVLTGYLLPEVLQQPFSVGYFFDTLPTYL